MDKRMQESVGEDQRMEGLEQWIRGCKIVWGRTKEWKV